MQRIFLTQEGYPYLCQLPLAQRRKFAPALLKLLAASQAADAGMENFSCGDVRTFLLNLDSEYQALIRQMDHPDEGPSWIILTVAPKGDIRERASTLRLAWDGETATVLRVASDGCAALNAENGPERGLAQADHRLLADMIESVAQAHCRRLLYLARRRRSHRGDENQLAVFAPFQSG